MHRRPTPPTIEPLEDRSVPATLTVTSLADSGPGTLRAAVEDANSFSGPDTIRFGVIGLIALESALPDIGDDLVIDGPGPGGVSIERSATAPTEFSLFTVTGVSLDLRGLTLANGSSSGFSFNGVGVTVRDGASLEMSDCVVRDFTTYYGPVIDIDAATAQIRNTLFSGTTRGAEVQQRGVIHNYGGTLLVVSSAFVNNVTGVGGAILTEASDTRSASTLLSNTTITGTSGP
ncbi:MAG: hypothetical protein ACRC33_07440, partial [Gemmataceae bacterium]